MVYPNSRLPLTIEIAPGAVLSGGPGDWPWFDVTGNWRVRSGITIEEGRGDWGARVDAGKVSLTFDDRTGDFSEHNPLGQWYGKLGKNTPLRVRLRRGEDAFGRTVSNGLGTADSGQVWTALGGAPSDYSVIAGAARHSHGTIGLLRSTTLGVNLVDTEQLVDASTSALLTGAALVTGVLARYQDPSNYYWLRTEFNSGGTSVMLKISKRIGGVETQLAVLNPVPSLAYAAGVPLRTRASVVGSRLAIKVWKASDPEPLGWMLEATDTDLAEPGQAGLQTWVVAGNTNALPVLATFANYKLFVDLGGGYVPAWVPRWDKSSKDVTVSVTANGVLYLLQPGQSKPPPRSPLRRAITSRQHTGLLAYWPCEDGADAQQAASGIPGRPPLNAIGNVTFASLDPTLSAGATVRYGTGKLPDVSLGGGLVGGVVPPGSSSPVQWTVQFPAIASGVGSAPSEMVFLRWRAGSSVWEVGYTGPPDYDTILRVDGVERIRHNSSFQSLYEWRIEAWQAGTDIAAQLIIVDATRGDVIPGGASPWTAVWAGTLGWPNDVGSNTTATVTSPAVHTIGHIQVWDTVYAPKFYSRIVNVYGDGRDGAWRAFNAESPHERLARLCAEDGIAFDSPTPEKDAVVWMGAQPDGTSKELHAQCEDADGGVLYERPFGLAYRPRASLYNQQPALVLDAQNDLAEAPEPDRSDQRYRNRVEVKRTGGSSAVAEAPEVADGAPVYEESTEINIVLDSQLPDAAGWRLHLAANGELRWPKLELDLAARPELIDQWLNCRTGSRIRATNPMRDVAGRDIDVLLEGASTTLGHKDFDITANCSPARSWDVAEADGDQRAGADGSSLAAVLALGATSFSLASTVANGPWVTGNTVSNPTDFPMDVRVGGERVRISGISGATPPQIATVPPGGRGINGVTRSWPAGTPVDVWEPAIAPQ